MEQDNIKTVRDLEDMFPGVPVVEVPSDAAMLVTELKEVTTVKGRATYGTKR